LYTHYQITSSKGFPLVKLISNKIFAISLVLASFGLAACSSTMLSPTATQFLTPTTDPVIQGREVFTRVCAECHGDNGEGYANELQSPALNHTEHAYHHPDQQIHDWIVNGKLGLGRQMPPLGEQLTDDEVHAVIAYLHTLWTPEQLEIQQDITSRWPATPEPGREP
jgi:mono/diheme cytochrome c family protein